MITYGQAPERVGEVRLSDGRLLGWAEWGPREGVPVLLSPGAATSRSLGFGTDHLEALDVRLVSLDRPGLGVSTPAPGRTFADFVSDVGQLTALLGLERPRPQRPQRPERPQQRPSAPERPLMVGNSQGAPFALACAEAGLVSALAVVSGADEISAPEFAAALPEELSGLVERVATDPGGAEEFFAGFSPDAMWELVRGGSPPCDLAVYEDSTFADGYRRALREGFAQGAGAGYARDTVLAMGRWPFSLAKISVPVDLWYGERDTSHSPDNGAFLATRIPTARRRLVPEAGGALLWTHAHQILTTLLRHDRTPLTPAPRRESGRGPALRAGEAVDHDSA